MRDRKISVRFSEEDTDRLTEIRLALASPTDGDAIRRVLEIAHARMSRAARRRGRAEARARELDPVARGQLLLWGGGGER